jgi:hypothetical protein
MVDVLSMVILCDTISIEVIEAVTSSFASANSAFASSKPGQGFEMQLGWLSLRDTRSGSHVTGFRDGRPVSFDDTWLLSGTPQSKIISYLNLGHYQWTGRLYNDGIL